MCLPCWKMWVLGLFDVIVVYYMIRCECWACPSDEQVRCKCWVKTYMMGRATTSMKKGWLCRTSSDENNHEIAPVKIQYWWSSRDDPDWGMIQIQRWCSRDDPDRVMIQIQRWRWLEDEDDLKMKMTWRWRWPEDEDDLKMNMTWRCRW